jgi:hypothetical protein
MSIARCTVLSGVTLAIVACGGGGDPLGGPYGGSVGAAPPASSADLAADLVDDGGDDASSSSLVDATSSTPAGGSSSGGKTSPSSGGETSSSSGGSTHASSSSGGPSGSSGSGGGSSSGSTTSSAPTWSQVYADYLARGTVGNCPSCHSQMSSATGAYSWLKSQNYISGTSSSLVSSFFSCLSWYGGNMPPGGRSDAAAVTAMDAWAAAGALDN